MNNIVTPILEGTLRLITTDQGASLVGKKWPDGEEVTLRTIDQEEVRYVQEPAPGRDRSFWERDMLNGTNSAYVDPSQVRVLFTTAPVAYDYGCTITLEVFQCAALSGEGVRTWRKVMIRGNDGFSGAQVPRYLSGLHGPTEEDPRIAVERQIAAHQAKLTDQALLNAMTLQELEVENERRLRSDANYDEMQRCISMLARRCGEARQAQRDAARAELAGKVEGKTLCHLGMAMEVSSVASTPLDRPAPHLSVSLLGDDGGWHYLDLDVVVQMVDDGKVVPPNTPPRETRLILWSGGLNPLQAKCVYLGDKPFYVGRPRKNPSGDPIVIDPETGKRTRRQAVIGPVLAKFFRGE